MAEIGMDVDAVRVVATNIDTQAHALSSIISSIDGLVGRLGHAWQGHDAVDFTNWWNSQHKPALVKVQTSIAGLAQSARNNAAEQDTASSSSGASGGSGRPNAGSTAFSTTAPGDANALAAAEALAKSVTHSAGKEFPDAVAKMNAWERQLNSGAPSAADIEAFRRYVVLIDLAHVQRSTVVDAAALAVSSFKDEAQSSAAAVISAAGIIPGERQLTLGQHLASADLHTVRDLAADMVAGGLANSDPGQIVSAYDLSADQFLSSVVPQSVGALHTVNSTQIFDQAFNSLSQPMSDLQNISTDADWTHAITGDGSPRQDLMTNILGEIPGFGSVYSAVSAEASGMHAEMAGAVATGSIYVANIASLASLQAAASSLQLAP